MVGLGAGNSADELALAQPAEELVHAFGGQSPPVGTKGDLEGGMTEDGGRPLDRVDLGQQGGVDQPGSVE